MQMMICEKEQKNTLYPVYYKAMAINTENPRV